MFENCESNPWEKLQRLPDSPSGMNLLRKLVAALDLPGSTERVVIVAGAREPARIYVKGVLRSSRHADIVQAVRDVTVDDEGNVAVELPDEPVTLTREAGK